MTLTSSQPDIDLRQLQSAWQTARSRLMEERIESGWWEGELSTSALSTATAVVALEMVQRYSGEKSFQNLIDGGLKWLSEHQNEDGGWGDTVLSFSNISTTMLTRAAFEATGTTEIYSQNVTRADSYINRLGGVDAVIKRYGKDKTFSVPILTQCALAGLVDWKEIPALPFELAWFPHRFYKTIKLPVVSYALPALIAIGQVKYHFAKPWNPLMRLLRKIAIKPTLQKLESIQPTSGGFLEAAPLTSFVTMSLAAKGLPDHPVAQKGVEFLVESVRADGSWPIDTNLATWVTTLSINAVQGDLSPEEREPLLPFLVNQQYKEVHPYTNADPGGWAWTDLSGGVPDADDTPGAILALLNLKEQAAPEQQSEINQSVCRGVEWLLDLQNNDGGWPTFCRGWGVLPFDRSAPDLTAHCLRAFKACLDKKTEFFPGQDQRVERAIRSGFNYLRKTQAENGTWLPLWFGNQHAEDEENLLYGTARVLAAWRDHGLQEDSAVIKGIEWIRQAQHPEGGWSGQPGLPPSVEETALAVEILIRLVPDAPEIPKGLSWLIEAVKSGLYVQPSPIGFYFAKLWYFERLYPLIFTVSTLRCACLVYGSEGTSSYPTGSVDGKMNYECEPTV